MIEVLFSLHEALGPPVQDRKRGCGEEREK